MPLLKSPWLFGLHEGHIGGLQHYLDKPSWILFTEEVGRDPQNKAGKSFKEWTDKGFWPVVRVNHGYGSAGTIPHRDFFEPFAERVSNYVAASDTARYWIIGNEPNLAGERPDGWKISPEDYAKCFLMCRQRIKMKVGNRGDIIMPAPVAPWNIETGYWMDYFVAVLKLVEGNCDGIALHTYTHGSDPALIASEAHMNEPNHIYRYQFRAYQDFMAAIPKSMRNLPVLITETDQNEPWLDQPNSWIQASYKEIDWWNKQPDVQTIQALIQYRFPKFDKWHMQDKQHVLRDFEEAVKQGYRSPEPRNLAPVLTQPKTPTATVTADIGANIRIGPGMAYKALGAVIRGTPLSIVGRSTDSSWWQVQSDWGKGWVSNTVVDVVNVQNIPIVSVTLPVTPPPATQPSSELNKDWLFRTWCRVLGINETVGKAILAIESGGRSFEGHRMIIRFENHIFHSKIKQFAPQLEGTFQQHFKYGNPSHTGHYWRQTDSSFWYEVHIGSQTNEWTVFTFARTIHETAAMQSISMGSAQVMGFNYATVGYPSVQAMFADYNDQNLGEYNQLAGFFSYIVNTGELLPAVKRKDFEVIALLYNGAGNVPTYASLLRNKYKELGGV